MTATSTFHRLGVFTALMTAVSGCSSQEFLAGAQGRLNQPKVNVESQSSNSGQSVSEKELESDRENPPVEVAGANLVGDCFFLSDGPPDAQDGAVECTMSGSNSEPMMIVARSPHLHMGTQDAAPVDGTLLGFRGPNPNSFLVSDAEPLRAHFTVSKNEIAALSSAEIMLSFDQLNVEGGVRAISSTMKMKVHKKKVNPNATCAFGVKMTRSDFSLLLQVTFHRWVLPDLFSMRLQALKLQAVILHWNSQAVTLRVVLPVWYSLSTAQHADALCCSIISLVFRHLLRGFLVPVLEQPSRLNVQTNRMILANGSVLII